MNTQIIANPFDAMIEVVATNLVLVGGYKDAAEAVRVATELIEDFAGADAQTSLEAAMALRVLTIQAQGASNASNAAQQNDADESVRFVADEDTPLPEGPLSDASVNPDDAIRALLQSIFGPTAQIIKLGSTQEDDGFITTPCPPGYSPSPFGGYVYTG